jgi:hypothetical protein
MVASLAAAGTVDSVAGASVVSVAVAGETSEEVSEDPPPPPFAWPLIGVLPPPGTLSVYSSPPASAIATAGAIAANARSAVATTNVKLCDLDFRCLIARSPSV